MSDTLPVAPGIVFINFSGGEDTRRRFTETLVKVCKFIGGVPRVHRW